MKVVKLLAQTDLKPKIDLETIHETLAYMRDDVARVAELQSIADALDKALTEIDIAQQRSTVIANNDSDLARLTQEHESVLAPPSQAQFVPFTRAF